MLQENTATLELPKGKSFASKHSNYTLPKVERLAPSTIKVISKKVYEFIGLPSHMPVAVRKELMDFYHPNTILVLQLQWDAKGYWNVVSIKSTHKSPLVKYELYVKPVEAPVKRHEFEFELQTDWSFAYMEHLPESDDLPLFKSRIKYNAYRAKSIETCIKRVIEFDCGEKDIINFKYGATDSILFTKSDLLAWLYELQEDNNQVLLDKDLQRCVEVKVDNQKYFITTKEFNKFKSVLN